MEHEMPDFLVDFFAERNYRESTRVVSANTPRKEWKPRPVSWRKIPFQLSTGQKETFSTLEYLLRAKMSSTDLVLLRPSLPPCCPKCSSQCIGLPRKALCFLKKQMLHCEGKKFIVFPCWEVCKNVSNSQVNRTEVSDDSGNLAMDDGGRFKQAPHPKKSKSWMNSPNQKLAGVDLMGGCRGCTPPPPYRRWSFPIRIYVFAFNFFLPHRRDNIPYKCTPS